MGKNLIQQKRGKGSPSYKRDSFKSAGIAKNPMKPKAKIVDLFSSRGHTAPLAAIQYEDGLVSLMVAPEGVRVGDILEKGREIEIRIGNTLSFSDLPEGINVYNIEAIPGDGGKLVRATGQSAKLISKTKNKAIVRLPSGKSKEFNLKCMATIGTVAGAGRTEKPFLKAGFKKKAMDARGKYWPIVSGASMNAVDHPLGGARSSRKGRPTIAPKNAPPGRKVGMLKPRHTGRNK